MLDLHTPTTPTKNMPVSVAIICHNYGHYLREAVESVLAQSLRPVEVLVIDDASTDNTAAVAAEFVDRVSYIRVDTGNVWLNRLRAIDQMRGDWVLCLDADNTIPPEYLQRAVEIGSADPACGIVWPPLNRFGDEFRYVAFDSPPPITCANHIDAGAVYRREAIAQADLSRIEIDPSREAEDWLLARRVLANGWTAHRNTNPLNYRVHGEQKHIRRLTNARTYYEDASLRNEPVTIIVPFSGRGEIWTKHLRHWLQNQAWPRHLCRLHILDSSGCGRLRQTLRQWIGKCDYPDVRITELQPPRAGFADEPRAGRKSHSVLVNQFVAGIYNRAIHEASTEYCLTLEDDVIPHRLDAIDQLMHGMDRTVAAVTAAYPHRDHKRYLVWRGTAESHQFPAYRGEGIEQIDGCGFGCLLLRRSVFSSLKMTSTGPTIFYDCNVSDTIRAAGWQLRVNWDLLCDHHAESL